MGHFSLNWGTNVNSVTRDNDGNWFYETFSSLLLGNRKDKINDAQKIQTAIENPAFLKILSLNCDLFSLGKINSYENDKLKERDFLYGLKKRPNFYQTWTQFDWEYMFYRMIFGYAVLRRSGNILNDSNQLYWLNPAKIQFKDNAFSKQVFSQAVFNKMQKETITYTHYDGSKETISVAELSFIQDLTNTCNNNYYKGASRMDALYKVISNSDNALDAKGVNLNFAQKFLFSGKTSADNISATPMKEEEKLSIENAAKGNKKVHAVKSPVSVDRFVKDIANLKLDESYMSDLFLIGSMYNIPRDVIEASIEGSTYENQEKSTGRHVEYSLKPAGQALTDVIEETFSLQDIRMEWTHLAFNQVFEKDRSERQKLQLENLKLAQDLGVTIPDLDTRITEILSM